MRVAQSEEKINWPEATVVGKKLSRGTNSQADLDLNTPVSHLTHNKSIKQLKSILIVNH